jgi:hypothetical protein
MRLLFLALTLAAAACNASSQVEECERLQSYSCGCFPLCQGDDRAAIESHDPGVCARRLEEDFRNWQACASGLRPSGMRCDQACTYGWGTCAFEVYQQAGLAADDVCDKVK